MKSQKNIIGMNHKMDHQLNWIINNEASYSKAQVKAAHEELKRRSNTTGNKLNDGIEKYWNFFKNILGFS